MYNGEQAHQKCGFDSHGELRIYIIKLQEEGLTKTDIMNKLNLGYTTINRLFKKYNIIYKQNHLLHRICGFNSKEEFISFIKDKYDSGNNIEAVAEMVGTNYITLREYFERNKIQTRTMSEYIGLRSRGERLSNEELEIINGCLLGDGCLYKRKYSASLSYSCKYESICLSLKEHLPNLYTVNPRKYSYIDARTNKLYSTYRIDSVSNFHFMELRNKWYPNEKKIVPRDLILTPKMCYWWYLGDGSSGDSSLMLCTNGFTIDDVEFLLSVFPVRATYYLTKKQQPIIHINKIEDRCKFLEYIGNCRHVEYNNRWCIQTKRGPILDYCLPLNDEFVAGAGI